jgi:protein TonB
MAKPLRTDDLHPASMQFSHFGVLHDGQQSKGSLFTSVTINVILAIIVCIIGAAAKKTVDDQHRLREISLSLPLKPIEPVKPKVIPKPLPPPPVVKTAPPKITMPQVKEPEPIKTVEVKMPQPAPAVPAPPKQVVAPAAPKPVSLAHPQAASVVNNSPHPTAVALGRPDNPIAPSNRPATAAINLGQRGLAGMPASNTGTGPRATAVSLGSGNAGSQQMAGNGSRPVQGVKLGVSGGTGPMNSTSRTAVAGPVNLGQVAQPAMPKPVAPTQTAARPPKVLYKPRPQYTQEAIQLRIEGTVSVRVRVSSTGTVHVVGVTSDLGHGLGESAIRAVEATRFQPATDSNGRPVDWEGIVNVAFQLAG